MLDFLQSFDTVAGEFEASKNSHRGGQLTLSQLIAAYGHLRPGTYELAAQAYWEDPDKYIVVGQDCQPEAGEKFQFSQAEKQGFELFLNELGSVISAEQLTEYIVSAIKSREYLKFEFSRNLSKALDLCVVYGSKIGIPRTDLSYIEYVDLEQIKLNAVALPELKKRIEVRKQNHSITRLIELPGLIQRDSDFYCFERIASQPNFITGKVVEGQIQQLVSGEQIELSGKLVMIPQADPGYDWLFAHGIAGLITQYGGANSHMAIRAAEIGLPAAIGVGDKLYEKIAAMNRVELDCGNQTIRKIQ
jgi:phosphohistidine swiveling domain-containing protein